MLDLTGNIEACHAIDVAIMYKRPVYINGVAISDVWELEHIQIEIRGADRRRKVLYSTQYEGDKANFSGQGRIDLTTYVY